MARLQQEAGKIDLDTEKALSGQVDLYEGLQGLDQELHGADVASQRDGMQAEFDAPLRVMITRQEAEL